MTFRRMSRDSVPDTSIPLNVKILAVKIPPLSHKGLESLVEEGFLISIEEGISDAIRRYITWARREIKKREKFRERKRVVSLDGYVLKGEE